MVRPRERDEPPHALVFSAPAVARLGDTPVPPMTTGDGTTDVAISRKATGEWLIFGPAAVASGVSRRPAARGQKRQLAVVSLPENPVRAQ